MLNCLLNDKHNLVKREGKKNLDGKNQMEGVHQLLCEKGGEEI